MTWIKRLVPAMLVLVSLLAAAPAIANDDGAPLLVTAYRPAARATTPREQLLVPTTQLPPGTSLADALSDKPVGRIPIPALNVSWASTIPAANRRLGNCLDLTTDWDASQGRVVGTLDNSCHLSIRIRATYGFRTGRGGCAVIDRIDGVLMPAFGRRVLRWQGSDDRAQTACIAAIDVFGVPQWPAKLAESAQAWLAQQANGGLLTQLNAWDKDGDTRAPGSGNGTINAASIDEPCVLTLSSPSFGQWNGTKAARKFTIRWADVADVDDTSYNKFVSIAFKDAVGREAWALDFSTDFTASLSASGFDPTVAASILTEYCRGAEKL